MIFKYPLNYRIEMPKGARLLTVQMQHEAAHLWALVNPEAPTITRNFNILGTGQPLPTDRKLGEYVATYQDGPFVLHVFDTGEET